MSDEKQVNTTGHQWDDEEGYPLQEYNNPLPKWWLYSYYATVVYAILYWILYPAWPVPGGYTKGVLGWSMHSQLAQELEASNQAKQVYDNKIAALSPEEIVNDVQLLQYAVSGGKAVFGDNCAPCHGSGGIGSRVGGFPTLVDDDWLYGGTLATIGETIRGGRGGQMPAHLESAGGSFSERQVDDLVQYVLSFTKRATEPEAVKRGETLFRDEAGCNGCHGDAANGSLKGTIDGESLDAAMGAPNLTDTIWLYGGEPAVIKASIAKGRHGKMPAWAEGSDGNNRKLSDLAIKQVSIYVHTLGGGQ